MKSSSNGYSIKKAYHVETTPEELFGIILNGKKIVLINNV